MTFSHPFRAEIVLRDFVVNAGCTAQFPGAFKVSR
jgi:hypothetical protein